MWIISKKYGVFNTDNLYRIETPSWDENITVAATTGSYLFPVAASVDDYQKILTAIKNGDSIVEVS